MNFEVFELFLHYLRYATETTTLMILGVFLFGLGRFNATKYILCSVFASFLIIISNVMFPSFSVLIIVVMSCVYRYMFKVKMIYALIISIFLNQLSFLCKALLVLLLPGASELFISSFGSLILFIMTLIIVKHKVQFTFLRSEFTYYRNFKLLVMCTIIICTLEFMLKYLPIYEAHGAIVTLTCIVFTVYLSLHLEFS